MKRLAAFMLLITVLTGTVQATDGYSETFKLDVGSDIQLGSYELRYYSGSEGDGIFQTGVIKQNGGTLITEQLTGDEIEEAVGEKKVLDSDLNYTIAEAYRGVQGRYLMIQANSSKDVFASANLESDNPQRVLVDQGGTVSFTVQLENTGVVNQTFQLYNTGEGVSSSFNYQGYNVSQVYVPYGQTRTLNVELSVAENTPVGLTEVGIVAENRSKASDSVLLSVLEKETQERGEPSIDVNLREQYARANPDETLSVPVTVRNSGQIPLDNVEVTVEGPDGWSTEVVPSDFGSLDRYRSGRATLEVDVPADASPGDYFVDVSASSDQIGIEEPKQIRVNITEKSGLRYIGIVIMVLSLAALIFVYRRFGRR